MEEDDFEGTIVWEALARIDALEEFIAAIDSDDSQRVAELMRSARIDEGTIAVVLKKMCEPDDQH